MTADHPGEAVHLLASGSLWRTLFWWHWDAMTRTLDNTPVDRGKGWALSSRKAEADRDVWLVCRGAKPLSRSAWADWPGSRPSDG